MSNLEKILSSFYADDYETADADLSSLEEGQILAEEKGSGDEALQAILARFVMDNATGSAQAKRLSNAFAGIKMSLVNEIIKEFPTTSVEALREAAEAAGYQVELVG